MIYDGRVVTITREEFAKTHHDYKNTTKGEERILVLAPKTGATTSAPVEFVEEFTETGQLAGVV